MKIIECFFSTLIQMQESSARYLSAHNNTLNPLYNNLYRHTKEAFFIQSIHGWPMGGMLKPRGQMAIM